MKPFFSVVGALALVVGCAQKPADRKLRDNTLDTALSGTTTGSTTGTTSGGTNTVTTDFDCSTVPDFPLGSPCGEPFDNDMQGRIVAAALDLLETAKAPRSTITMPLVWSKGEAWKDTVFTAEQPFLSKDQVKNWETRKQRYRDQKAQ